MGLIHLRRSLLLAVASWLVVCAPAQAQLGSLLSPGRLARAHEKLEGLANCAQCHESGRRVTAAKCLACHAPVAERIARGTGVHKGVTECVACHSDHAGVNGELRPFDPKTFDHRAVTGFALDGRHADLKEGCAACHKQRTYLDVKTTCASCHADVHKPSLGSDCLSCHSTKTPFKEGGFDHSRAAFQLTGAHRQVTCEKCHVRQQFRGVAFATCASCHRDPHRPAQGTNCASCHTSADSWRSRQFDHGRTAFQLVGQHQQVECAACHKQPAMRVKPRADSCATCHADVHRGAFKGQDCKACHTESSFAKAPFDHGRTKFALTGKHAPLACEACHAAVPASGPASAAVSATNGRGAPPRAPTPAPAAAVRGATARRSSGDRVVDFTGLATSCVSCHADVHQAQLGTACESCHNVETFKVATFTHTVTPPSFFAGEHAALTCSQCHKPPGLQGVAQPVRTGLPLAGDRRRPPTMLAIQYRGVQTACATCHQDVHLGQVGMVCESCHAIDKAKFAAPAFQHARTAFRLTGKHETTTCGQCHKRETGAFPAGAGTAVRYKGVGSECRACHEDVHLGQVEARCETCHTTAAFRIPRYTHRNARRLTAFFVGAHARQECAACHPNTTAQFPAGRGTSVRFAVDTRCTSCHTDIHRGSLGSECATCHKP